MLIGAAPTLNGAIMRNFCKIWSVAATLAAAFLSVALIALPARAQQSSQDLEVLKVQPNLYMIAGAGGNIGVQLGPAGVILVDTGTAAMSDKVLAAVKRLSDKPIRYIVDTSAEPDHVGGNAKLSKA